LSFARAFRRPARTRSAKGGAEAVYNASGLLYYGHSDHLGSIRLGSTSSREVSFDLAYAPFGETYSSIGSVDSAFTGQRPDSGNGIYDFPAREYSNEGRWASPDPAGLAAVDLTNPQSWNRYAYVLNNPLIYVDPTGLCGDPYQDPAGQDCMGQFPGSGANNGNINGCTIAAGCTVYVYGSGPGPGDVQNPGQCYEIFLDGVDTGKNTCRTSGGGGSGGGGGGGNSSGGQNNFVPANPCQYAGRALDPSAYASQGKSDNGHPFTIVLNSVTGFPRGHFFDAQPLAAGTLLQRAAYGNYVYGVYMAAAGIPLSTALSAGNAYAFLSGATYDPKKNGPFDPKYGSIPAANVTNITNGYNAQKNGTACTKQPLLPPPAAPPF
jgi:RHS repeat-associated protein